MTRMPNITYCFKHDSLIHAAKKLIDKQIDALPVVQEHSDGFEVIGRINENEYYRCLSVISGKSRYMRCLKR